MHLTREQIEATAHLSSRQAARALSCGKTSVNKYRKLYGTEGEIKLPKARVLILDIESKPLIAYVWDKKPNWIPDQQIIDFGGMMCFAAKWLGESEVFYHSEEEDGYSGMVRAAYKLLDQADIVVTYNGDRYDIKRLNNEFLKMGLTPPSPFRSIDLFKTNRKQFDLPSRKLDYIAGLTGVGNKIEHTGFKLWIDCLAHDPEAWALMRTYNEEDVRLTERLYIKLLPWLTNIPHMGMFVTDGACPYCGFDEVQDTGRLTRTHVQTYKLFQCTNCEGYSRGNKPVKDALQTRKV